MEHVVKKHAKVFFCKGKKATNDPVILTTSYYKYDAEKFQNTGPPRYDGFYAEFRQLILKAFSDLNENFMVSFIDEEGDRISITDNETYEFAQRSFKSYQNVAGPDGSRVNILFNTYIYHFIHIKLTNKTKPVFVVTPGSTIQPVNKIIENHVGSTHFEKHHESISPGDIAQSLK